MSWIPCTLNSCRAWKIPPKRCQRQIYPQTIVNLIAATTTETGLDVHCKLDDAEYEKGRKVTDDEMAVINIRRHRFHPEWNYTISPRS